MKGDLERSFSEGFTFDPDLPLRFVGEHLVFTLYTDEVAILFDDEDREWLAENGVSWELSTVNAMIEPDGSLKILSPEDVLELRGEQG